MMPKWDVRFLTERGSIKIDCVSAGPFLNINLLKIDHFFKINNYAYYKIMVDIYTVWLSSINIFMMIAFLRDFTILKHVSSAGVERSSLKMQKMLPFLFPKTRGNF